MSNMSGVPEFEFRTSNVCKYDPNDRRCVEVATNVPGAVRNSLTGAKLGSSACRHRSWPMNPCPRCGGEAVPDAEHERALRCLSCWHTWALPKDTSCPDFRLRLMPALRVLDEYRDLNR